MVRAELIRLSASEHILVVTMHHIASDASSMPVLVREVAALYSANVSGIRASLPELTLQYSDYAVWQRKHIQGNLLEEKLKYWKKKLEDVMPLQLPGDGPSSDGGTRSSTFSFVIDKRLSQQVLAVGHSHGATLYMTLLAAFKVLLYRYSGQEDICVGTSVAGRPQRELEGLIGFFVNTLALRDQVKGEMSFIELLKDVKGTTLDAYAHQEVPFEKVVEAVVKERQTGFSPLFQVMLVLINTPETPELKLGELSLSTQGQEQTTAKFDLTFFIRETKDGMQGTIQYNTDLYGAERIARMASHFTALLQSVVNSPQTAVGKLELLSKQEQSAELQLFGISESAYPKEATIADLFEAQAQKHPEETAVVFAGEAVSYKELNERANALAQELQRHGVKEDTLVPLYIERGLDMLTGILGILKAGGAYVPIDTEFPAERVSYMLEDTGAQVAVSSGEYTVELQKLSGGYVAVVGIDSLDKTAVRANPQRSLKAADLAYVIYTSGSTGKPKGVAVSHGNVVDYVYGLDARTGISKCKSFALVSSIATDLGNTVLYSSLLLGGTLHVFTRETVSHIEEIHEYFEEHQIDCLKIVPSHWKALSPEAALRCCRAGC